MAEEFKKTGLMDGMGENNDDDDFKNDPEGGGNKALRLPFALCKAKGIKIQDWWTPRDAWNALKSGGYVEDVDEEYAKHLKEEKREKKHSPKENKRGKDPALSRKLCTLWKEDLFICAEKRLFQNRRQNIAEI